MNTQTLEEAAEWLIELNSGDPVAHERFDAWLRASPENVRAYLELLSAWEVGTELPTRHPRSEPTQASDAQTEMRPGERPDPTLLRELIEMGRRPPSNLSRIGPLTARPDLAGPDMRIGPASPIQPDIPLTDTRPARRPLHRLAAAASVMLAGWLIAGFYLRSQQGLYAAGIGEQRIIRLDDGSTIELDSRSNVRTHYGIHEREVELLQGRVMFQVAHDPKRPFVVRTDHARIRAVGTQFDVYEKATGTVVTVVEGRVAVTTDMPPDSASTGVHSEPVPESSNSNLTPSALDTKQGELLLTAGQQLTVTSAAFPEVKVTNVSNVTAWTQRRLVFDDSTLREVIEEFNRYNKRRLVLRDPSLASFPITAAFSSPDSTSLVRFLRAQPDIEVRETPDEILIERK